MTYGRREPNRQAENNLKKVSATRSRRLRPARILHTPQRRHVRDGVAREVEASQRAQVFDRVVGQVQPIERRPVGRWPEVRDPVDGQVPTALSEEIRWCRFSTEDRELGHPEVPPLGKCSGNVPRSLTRTLTVSVNPSGSPEMQVRRLDPDPVTVGPLPMGLRQQPVPNGRRCASPDPPTRLGPRPAPARHRCRKRPRLHHSERSSLPCAHAVEFVVPPPGC